MPKIGTLDETRTRVPRLKVWYPDHLDDEGSKTCVSRELRHQTHCKLIQLAGTFNLVPRKGIEPLSPTCKEGVLAIELARRQSVGGIIRLPRR